MQHKNWHNTEYPGVVNVNHTTPIAVEEFNGHKVLVINADHIHYCLKFGLAKARAIIQRMSEIKDWYSSGVWISDNEYQETNGLKFDFTFPDGTKWELDYKNCADILKFSPDIEKFVSAGGAYAGI